MQAIPFKIHFSEDRSIHIQENEQAYQYDVFHSHPELQISLILSGHGKFNLAQASHDFREEDVFVIAPNVPHAFKNHETFYKKNTALKSHFISIFFLPELFEQTFFKLGEMRSIRQFFLDFQGGFKVASQYAIDLVPLIKGLKAKPLALQLVSLMQVLHLLVQEENKIYLKTTDRWHSFLDRSKRFYNRLEPAFEYLHSNLEKSISLEEVSRISHMSPSSFSRYFKLCTRKTFSNYLSELRIQKACKLLKETDFSIYRISLETGFQNLSNFNRHFKKLMKLTPSQFRKVNT